MSDVNSRGSRQQSRSVAHEVDRLSIPDPFMGETVITAVCYQHQEESPHYARWSARFEHVNALIFIKEHVENEHWGPYTYQWTLGLFPSDIGLRDHERQTLKSINKTKIGGWISTDEEGNIFSRLQRWDCFE